MSVSADYRRLLKRELKIRTIIEKSFKKQSEFLQNNVKDLYENYKLNIEITRNNLNNEHVHLYPDKKDRYDVENNEPLWWFRKEMWVDDLLEDMKPQIKKAVEKWYKRSFRLFEPLLIENWFRYYYDTIDNYANKRWELQLSNYRWAISFTTKHDVIQILKNWIDNHLTVDEVAKQIEAKSEVLFWKWRANTIAVSEMWKAYEYWNFQPIAQLQSVWIEMEKKRETCHDSRVRETHRQCEEEWRVSVDYIYPSVWVDIAPWWPNCRCTMLYRRKK